MHDLDMERWLAGAEAAALTHAECEERLAERGRELLRLLHRAQLDLRAAREPRREQVTGPDGVARTRAERGTGGSWRRSSGRSR
jgi:hypothetical protein